MAWFMVELTYPEANKLSEALAREETVQIVYGPNFEDPIEIDSIEENTHYCE